MNSIVPNSNLPEALGLADLLDSMISHHEEEAHQLVELARWHSEQAHHLTTERAAIAKDITSALRAAEMVLQ